MNQRISEIKNEKQSNLYGTEKLALLGSEGVIVKKREYIKDIVDLPCLESCLDLYDKNIQTIGSSANQQDINLYGSITINYDSLSEENKKVVTFLQSKGIIEDFELSYNTDKRGGRDFSIKVPIQSESIVTDVSESFNKITCFFKNQDVLYGRFSKEHFFENEKLLNNLIEYGYLSIDENGECEEYAIISAICSYFGYVFDEDTHQFWIDQSLLDKHNLYINNFNDKEVSNSSIDEHEDR